MKWQDLLALIGREPVFDSALLLAGAVSTAQVRLQLSRWTAAGRLVQVRRGVYALAETWRKVEPHPFAIANAAFAGSYVSLQSALAWHGLIPEHVPVTTSVGPGRPELLDTPLGRFACRHVRSPLVFGYELTDVAPGQQAFVAAPEKALLDLVHLTTGGDQEAFLLSLRLQNLRALDAEQLLALAARAGQPKLRRAAERMARLLRSHPDA